MLPYFQDAAFQTWVLQQAFPDAVIKTFLMMPDKAQVAPIAGINQMFRILPDREVETTIPPGVDGKALAELLLAKVDVTPSVADILASPLAFPGGPLPFADAAKLWARQYANDEPVAPPSAPIAVGASSMRRRTANSQVDSASAGKKPWVGLMPILPPARSLISTTAASKTKADRPRGFQTQPSAEGRSRGL